MASLLDDIRRAKQKRASDQAGLLPDAPLVSPEISGDTPTPEPVAEAPAPVDAVPTVKFTEAFAAARKAGAKTFEWEGGEYNTQIKEEAAPAPTGTVTAGNVDQALGVTPEPDYKAQAPVMVRPGMEKAWLAQNKPGQLARMQQVEKKLADERIKQGAASFDQRVAEQKQAAEADPDSAWEYSVDQTQKLAGKGMEAIGGAFGFENIKRGGAEYAADQEADIALGGYQVDPATIIERYDTGGFGAALDLAGTRIAENWASTGATLVGGTAAALTAPFSVPAAAVLGGTTAVGATVLGVGEVKSELQEKGVDGNDGLAVGAGTLIGILDRFGAGKVIPKDMLTRATGSEIATALIEKGYVDAAKEVLWTLGKKAGWETGTEVAQEGVSVGAAASQGAKYTPKELFHRAFDTAVVALGMGGGAATVSTTAEVARSPLSKEALIGQALQQGVDARDISLDAVPQSTPTTIVPHVGNTGEQKADATTDALLDAAIQQATQPVVLPAEAAPAEPPPPEETPVQEAPVFTEPEQQQDLNTEAAPPMPEMGTPAPAAAPTLAEQVDMVAHDAATSPNNELPQPTEAQKEAGTYRKGHLNLQGLDIAIENPQGSERSGTDSDGEKWSVTMPHHYGYIKRTTGADGDQVDVYLGPNPESQQVFVVDQVNPDTGVFDEHKVLFGFDSQEEATAGYAAGFSDGRGGERAGAVTPMDVPQFKSWLKHGNTTLPLGMEATATVQTPAEGVVSSAPRTEATGETDVQPRPDQQTLDKSADAAGTAGSEAVAPALQPGSPHPGPADQQPLDLLARRFADAAADLDPADKSDDAEYIRGNAAGLAGITVVAPESLRDDGAAGRIGSDDVEFLAKLGDLSGIKFVYVNAPNTGAEQFTVPEISKTVYVDVSTPVSSAAAPTTAGHEITHIALHTLRNSADPVDRSIADTVDQLMEDNLTGENYLKYRRYYGDPKMAPAKLREEAASDIGGNLHADPAFWERVLDAVDAKHGATGVRKFIDAMKQALKKLGDLVQGRTFQEGYVTNATAVREAIAQALIRYYTHHGAGAEMAKTKANLALGMKPAKAQPPVDSKQPLVVASPKRTSKKGQQNEDTQTSTRSQPAADTGTVRPQRTRDGSGRDQGGRAAPGKVQAPERAAAQEALEGAPRITGFTGPDPRLVAVAEQYARSIGVELKRQAEYVQLDEDRARRLAAAYDAMPHAPQDPAVREAYDNLVRQTVAQYQALADAGYRFWFTDLNIPDNVEYLATPWNAMRDIRANQSMGVFPTDDGFGTSDFDPAENPLLTDTGLTWPVGSPDGTTMKRVLANDLFRAVHDAFGHGLEGAGFRAQGEENAWQAHVRLFTGSAVAAITSETRGQNSWLNYGPHGEANQSAPVEETVFADQKTGLMPEWTWTEGRVGDVKRSTRRTDYHWAAVLKSSNGPVYQGPGFVLDPIKPIPHETDFDAGGMAELGIMGHAGHVTEGATPTLFAILGDGGQKLGQLVADVKDKQLVAIHDLEVYTKRSGLGAKVVTQIVANSSGPVRVIEALDQSKEFWNKFGADHYDQYHNASIDWDGVRRYLDARPAGDQGRGDAAYADAGSPGTAGIEVSELDPVVAAGLKFSPARRPGSGDHGAGGPGAVQRSARADESEDAGTDAGRPDAARGDRDGDHAARADRGDRQEHAVQVTGVHYSQQPRDVLDSSKSGSGMPGGKASRLGDWSATPEQRHRIYFYVDEGNGIVPETGVGPHPHPVDLDNLYDAKQDPLKLLPAAYAKTPAPNLVGNFFEQAVMAAGFDGVYYRGAFGDQGGAILLGERTIEIKRSPGRQVDTPEFKSAVGNNGDFDATNPDIRRSTPREPKTPEQLRQDYARLVGQDDPAAVSFVDRAMEAAEKDWEAAKRGSVSHEASDEAAKRLAHRLGWSAEAVAAALAQGSVDVNGRAVPAAELLGAGAATARLSVAQLLADPEGADFSQRMASTINLMIATRANLSEIGRALSYAGWLERKPGVSEQQRTERALKSLDEATLAADQAVGVTANMNDAEKQAVADYNDAMRDLGDARMATEEVKADVDAAQADLTTARDQVRDARGARDAAKKQLSEANAGLKKAEQQRANAVDRTPGAFAITQAEGAARRAANEAQAAKDWEKLVKERLKAATDRLARANEMLQKARDNAVDPAELKRQEQKARMAEAEANLATSALKEAERKLREANKRLQLAQEKEAAAKAKTPTPYDISQAQGAARRAEQAAAKATADLRIAQRELAKLRARMQAAVKRLQQQEQRLLGVQQRVAAMKQPQFIGKGGVTMAEIEAAVGGIKGMQRIQRAMRAQGANLDLGQVAQFFQGVANAIYQKKLEATKHRGTVGALHNFMAAWLEHFRAFILTGIFTHGVNVVSNAAFQAIEMGITRPIAAALPGGGGAANHYKALTTALLRSAADVYAVLRFGMTQEFPAAHFEALAQARPGTRQDLLDLGGNKWMDQHGGALPGLYGKGVRTVGFSPLGAMDLLFKIVPYRYALAMQEAQGQPVDYGKAVEMAEYQTFQTALSEGMSGVQRFVGAHPMIGFIVPFIKTLVNLINRSLDYTPVLGQLVNRDQLLGYHGTDARNAALAQAVVGLGLALVTLALHGDGDDDDESKLSGMGPLDYNKQALWLANNEKLGLKTGDVVVPLWRLEPFASMMGLTIAAKDAYRLGSDTGDYAAAGRTVAAALGQVVVGKSFMKGAEEAMQAALDVEGRGWKYLTERLPQSMVLGSTIPNFIPQLGDMSDQYKRDAEGWAQQVARGRMQQYLDSWGAQVQRRVPGWRETLDPKLDYAGRPIPEPRHGTPLPLQAVPEKDDPTAAWAMRNEVPLQAMPKALKTDDTTGKRLPFSERERLLKMRALELSLAAQATGVGKPEKTGPETPEQKAGRLKVREMLKKNAREEASSVKRDWADEVSYSRSVYGLDAEE
jgi:hypothetical protein